MKKLRKELNEDGFSILEVMVSLIIFSVGLLLLMSMLVVSIKGNSWSEKTTVSSQLLREKVEQLKNTPTAGMVSGEETIGMFNRKWQVQNLFSDLYDVTVAVSWVDEDNRQFACTTQTYIQAK